MPATYRTPQAGRQPLGPLGTFGPPPAQGTPIAGPPPASILSGHMPNPIRQGSNRARAVPFDFPQKVRQDAPPLNPGERPLRGLIPDLLAADLAPAEARYVATLTRDVQQAIADRARTGPGYVDQITADRLVNAIMSLALTPGNPTPADVNEAAAEVLGIRPGTPYSDEDLDAARARIIGGGGTDAPEPTNQELFAEAAAARRENLLEQNLIFPIFAPPPWASETPPQPENAGGE